MSDEVKAIIAKLETLATDAGERASITMDDDLNRVLASAEAILILLSETIYDTVNFDQVDTTNAFENAEAWRKQSNRILASIYHTINRMNSEIETIASTID